ncbi:MAG TPA: type II secretion system F family protein [Streptosporangiaceae bacterium]|jgi:tight adherence protein C
MIMTMTIGIAAALCIVVLVLGYHLYTAERESRNAVAFAQAPKKKVDEGFILYRITELIGAPFGPAVYRSLSPKWRNSIQRRITAAGISNLTLERYARRRAGEVLLFGIIGLLALPRQFMLGALCIAVGLVMSDVVLFIEARTRQDKIQQMLPDFLDVLTVTVSAGLGFRNAISRVCASMPGPLSDELNIVLRQMELGVSRREAFEDLRRRNSSEAVAQFVTALLQAEEFGSPLSQALIEISTDMRRSAAQWARRKAQRTTPQVTGVTTATMLPSMLLLITALMYYGMGANLGSVFGS